MPAQKPDSRPRVAHRGRRLLASGETCGLTTGLLRPQHAIDGAHDLIPAAGLMGQLLAARGGQPVIARPAVVFRRAPERGDPAAVFQTVQSGIERAVLDLQDVFGAVFDGVGDGVPVRRDPAPAFAESAGRACPGAARLPAEVNLSLAWCRYTPIDHLLQHKNACGFHF